MKASIQNRRGFTLIEVLTTITIIAVLAALGAGGYGAAMRQARKAKEISAARALTSAYLSFPTDNNGQLMPGYAAGASVQLANGDVISGPTAERYPWRLASYAELKVEDTMMLNPAKQGAAGTTDYHYMVSLAPSLGMNAYCVGGYSTNNGYLAKGYCATNLPQLGSGSLSKLILFASAQLKQGKSTYEGNFIIKPPTMTKTTNVHYRYGNKAVVAYIDGHVETNTESELQDSRLWSAFTETATEAIRP